jgi:hypothetical protein
MQLELTQVSRGHHHGWFLYEARCGKALLFKLCATPCLAAEIAASLDKNYGAKSLIPLMDSGSPELSSRQGTKE